MLHLELSTHVIPHTAGNFSNLMSVVLRTKLRKITLPSILAWNFRTQRNLSVYFSGITMHDPITRRKKLIYLYPVLIDVQFLGEFFSDGESRKLFFCEGFFQPIKLLFRESCSATPRTCTVTLETKQYVSALARNLPLESLRPLLQSWHINRHFFS